MVRTIRSSFSRTLGPALIASAVAVVAALAIRYIAGLPTPAELYADQATTRIPLPIFETLLTTFGPSAKHLYFIAALLMQAILLALAGLCYFQGKISVFRRSHLRSGRTASPLETSLTWLDIPLIVAWLWFLSGLILAPIVGGGLLGAQLVGGPGMTLLSQLVPDAVFATIFVWLTHNPVPATGGSPSEVSSDASASPRTLSRRSLIRQSALAAGVLGGGIALWQALTSGLGAIVGAGPARSTGTTPQLSLSDIPERITPPPIPTYSSWSPVVGQTPELTSARDFYYVAKNLTGDPSISTGSWKLSIDGLVEKPYELSYDDLHRLPQMTQYHTLECISNEVGGKLMSNGFFTGVSLAEVLNHAHIQPGASQMTFTAADGYSDSIHLSQALSEEAMIAYLLDGEPLAQPHGYPARLLIPGLFGMKNGKWLTRLSLIAGSYTGYWETRGWSREAIVRLTSRIDTPHDGDLLTAKPTYIAGVAYGGAKGISRVDVSVDAGHTWNPALLRKPLGSLSWTLWEYQWAPAAGTTIIVVRAIDLDGYVQSPVLARPLPNGASGYHAITVTVR